MVPSESPSPEGVPLTRRWTATEGSAAEMARVLLRVQQRTPQALLVHLVIVVGFVLLAVFTPVSGIVAAVTALAVIVFNVWSDHRRLLKALRVAYPPGADVAVGVGEGGMTVRDPTGTTHCSFKAFRRLRLVHGYVLLDARTDGICHLYPRALFAEEDLEHLRRSLPS